MRNSCGGIVVMMTSFLISPGAVRQVNGVGVAVAGIGLGVKVAESVGGGGDDVAVWVGTLSFEAEQAESPARSEKKVINEIA